MLIKDLIDPHVIKIDKETTWLEALKLMEREDTNGLFVVDKHDKYLGTVTIAELIKAAVPPYMKEDPDLAKSAPPSAFLKLCDEKKDVTVKHFMNTNKPFYRPHTGLLEIVANTLGNDSYRLPVVDEHGKLMGVVNRRHIREAIFKHFKQ